MYFIIMDNVWATWCEELTHWKRSWCWERLRAGGEGDSRGWDGSMASPTRWTWVWVDSGSWWWTGRPGMLRFMGSQRVRLNWATEVTNANHKQNSTIFIGIMWGFPGGSVVKNLPANAEDMSWIPGSERVPGRGNGDPPPPLFLPGEAHEQQSPVGCSR